MPKCTCSCDACNTLPALEARVAQLEKAQEDINKGHLHDLQEANKHCREVEAERGEATREHKRLRILVTALQRDMAEEIRRQRNPGGQQVGISRLNGTPMSVLMQIERDCRHALEDE